MTEYNNQLEQILLKWTYQQRICNECETRIRFGDIECPHCGLDLEDSIYEWIIPLVKQISNLQNSK
tara:strand:- start:99 stop:296 length:198 start_codon:yes stop_codon:yes gene_type:complete